MTTTQEIKAKLLTCSGIAFDDCHKIYVLMDDAQVALMRGYGYETLITRDQATPREMMRTLRQWWRDSCGLRFIEAVTTNDSDPNAGFYSLIPQCKAWR